MGTSAPEVAVSISAALKGSNEIAISNVVGSNFFNLLVVVGLCAILNPIVITKTLIKRDFPLSIFANLLLILSLVVGFFINGNPTLLRLSGVLFLIIFAIYIYILVKSALKNPEQVEENIKTLSLPKSIIFILIGILGVVFGGDFVVTNAKIIASSFGMSDNLIGLTIVAVGTSLPELVTSVVAAKKNEADLALGNVIGSNIFNILFVLGVSASLNQISVGFDSIIDSTLLILVNLFVLIVAIKKKSSLGKVMGSTMIFIYVLYSLYIIARNYSILPF